MTEAAAAYFYEIKDIFVKTCALFAGSKAAGYHYFILIQLYVLPEPYAF
jgi:hypothetical protein